MTDRIKKITNQINAEKESSISDTLEQIEKISNLTDEEKVDLSTALSVVFYHDYSGMPAMMKLAAKVEKQIASFGKAPLPSLISAVIEADAESALPLARIIALSGAEAIKLVMETWDRNRSDDFAVVNLIQTLSYFRTSGAIAAMPEILVAAKSGNNQVRSMALCAAGKLVMRLSPDLFDESLRLKIFDTAFSLLSDSSSLVRMNASRTLGKMMKKEILTGERKEKVLKAFNAILGNDSSHEWDCAFIVRNEVEKLLPLCKAGETLSDRYRQTFRIINKRELCPKTFHFIIEAPLIAGKLQAGQFVIVRAHDLSERIPLSICGWDVDEGTIQIVVMAVGKTSTEIIRMNAGDCFSDIVGPLGERSHVKKHDGSCVVIGGGYGTGAVIPTAIDFKKLGNKVIGIVGARTRDLLIMVPELKDVCDDVLLTTNDGSEGIEGFVTHALEDLLSKGEKISHVLAIGPMPMMMAVSDMTKPLGIETYVSLNAIMVDGTGMCGACRVSVGGETKFACFHGPDFNGHEVDFEQLMKRQKMFIAEEKKAFATMEV